MKTTTLPSIDPTVALVGGVGVVLSHALQFGFVRLWQGAGLGLLASVFLLIGFSVIAFGLPGGGRGLLGESRVARWSLFASGALGLLVFVGGRFYPDLSSGSPSPGAQAYGVVLGCAFLAQLLTLVAAAVFAASSEGTARQVRWSLAVLAILAVAAEALSLVWGLVPVEILQAVADATSWQWRLFDLVACGAGVGIAWPWLAPRIDRLVAAATRARDRWVDSTP
jgi:hypothetical protein